jgi:hypothetical protein
MQATQNVCAALQSQAVLVGLWQARVAVSQQQQLLSL